ncbi:MAG: M23 family metallopeptidase [Paramuribaculum sp.]|nr:M23 family metallopeptidase [Paramuribaculum sp.]
MLLTKKIATSLLALAASICSVQAQTQLPIQHTNQHNTLIANQKPTGNAAALGMAAMRNAGPKIQIDNSELFNYNWDSQSVNGAYAGLPIPSIKDIDVTGYVAPVRGRLTSAFGYRARFGRMHKGVDLNLRTGDSIVAAFDGRVRITSFDRGGYGYYVVIRHDNGLETIYGHCSRIIAKKDQYVHAGELIALGGSTGRSTGPHLHFETRYMGIAINPADIIDFDNYVTHRDVFTFNKANCEKALSARPAKKHKATSSKRKGKKSAKASKRRGSKKKK